MWQSKHIRITFLTPRLVRLEASADGQFEDRQTLAVQNRKFATVQIAEVDREDWIELSSSLVTVRLLKSATELTADSVNVVYQLQGKSVTWWPGKPDPLNLGGAIRTLDKCDGDTLYEAGFGTQGKTITLEPGLLSRAGASVFDDSNSIVLSEDKGRQWVKAREPGLRQDLYVFAYGTQYQEALADAAKLFGSQPLPPRYAFGLWYCRYWAYLDRELEGMVEKRRAQKLPLDVLSIDMDWHCQGWTGFSWDHRYFSNPDDFLAHLKSHNLHICLNLHPAEGFAAHEDQYKIAQKSLKSPDDSTIEFDCVSPEVMSQYFETFLRPIEKAGVDFWWLDWQQGDKSKLDGLDPLPWLNQLHWEDQQQAYPDKRPICFSRYGGLGSGRHPVGFSGDTYVSWKSLEFQPYMTATAANVLYGYWSHDIGGHFHGELDGELFTRWMQFGALSPVLRVHGTKQSSNDRQFWHFGWPWAELMESTVQKRYELIPYLYSEARKTVDTGISLCRPLYLHHPNEEESYNASGEYYLGDHLLAAPVTVPVDQASQLATKHLWLPPGTWCDMATGEFLNGSQEISRDYLIEESPVFAKCGSVLPGQREATWCPPGSYRHLLITLIPGASGSYSLYEDDGESIEYRQGKSALIHCNQTQNGQAIIFEIQHGGGEFKGYLATRQLSLRLLGLCIPRKVALNGQEIPWSRRPKVGCWHIDADRGELCISCGEVSLSRRNRVDIELQDCGTQITFPVAGVARRLYWAFHHARVLEMEWERQIGGMAQISARIAHAPESATQEITALKEQLSKFLDAYASIHDDVSQQKRYTEKKLVGLGIACNLLKATAQLIARPTAAV
jgi:alpha-glucosidase (family GH31 glycosyl hydrolase)